MTAYGKEGWEEVDGESGGGTKQERVTRIGRGQGSFNDVREKSLCCYVETREEGRMVEWKEWVEMMM